MAEKTEDQKYCGQIIFLSTNDIAINCRFCQHDFYTLEAARAHLDEHFPELPSTIKKEDSMAIPTEISSNINKEDCINFGSDCELTEFAKNLSPLTLNTNNGTNENRQTMNESISNPKVQKKAKRAKEIFVPIEVSSNDKKQTASDGKVSKPKVIKSGSSIPKKTVLKHGNRYKCSICEKGFMSLSKLDIHTREQHLPDTDPRRYFPCQLCDLNCKTYRQLIRHRKSYHLYL